MSLSRRYFLTGGAVAIAAPAIITTPGLLMRVKRWLAPETEIIALPSGAWDSWCRTSLPQGYWLALNGLIVSPTGEDWLEWSLA